MKIAIQASDLDAERIDGTRVYILNLLRNFGLLDSSSQFLLYHKNSFNPELTPPKFSNYQVKKITWPFFWTQIRFALEVWKENPEVLWMPMQSLPFILRKKLKTVVTIHDLAFKYFPEHFPSKDFRRLKILSAYAIERASKIIAVSASTKKDILKFYPEIKEEKIKVIHHGFTAEVFSKERNTQKEKELLGRFGIEKEYILYAGAIQPRKNLPTLIRAFEKVRETNSQIQLVLAGEEAWLSNETIGCAKNSRFAKDIKIIKKLSFTDLGNLMASAKMFVLPSLYEGFGLPILEAYAAKVPVIAADNSSLPEVGGDGALYFDAKNAEELANKIKLLLSDKNLRDSLIQKASEQLKKFSWEKCAQETLEYLKS
jgi:glycosyltransferase involved in cell wall biosynthesis